MSMRILWPSSSRRSWEGSSSRLIRPKSKKRKSSKSKSLESTSSTKIRLNNSEKRCSFSTNEKDVSLKRKSKRSCLISKAASKTSTWPPVTNSSSKMKSTISSMSKTASSSRLTKSDMSKTKLRTRIDSSREKSTSWTFSSRPTELLATHPSLTTIHGCNSWETRLQGRMYRSVRHRGSIRTSLRIRQWRLSIETQRRREGHRQLQRLLRSDALSKS